MFGREIRSADSFRQASSYHSILFHRKLLHRNEGMHEPVDRIFRFERFDTELTRQTVGDLLCGAYDNRLYRQQLRVKAAEKEHQDATAEWRHAVSAFEGAKHPATLDWVEAERTIITQRLQKTREEAEALEEKIFNAEVSDGLTIKEQQGAYSDLVKAQQDLLALQTERDSLQLESADSQSFIEALEAKLEQLHDSAATADALRGIAFIFCPSCFAPINDASGDHVCSLCKSPFDQGRAQSRILSVINETGLQLKQSRLLQTDRLKELSELDIKVAAATRRWNGLSERYKLLNRLPSTELRSKARVLYGRAGYLERELDDLGQKAALIERIEALSKARAQLNVEITSLKEQIEASERRQKEYLSRAYTLISKKTIEFLRNDLPRQDTFSKAASLSFSFGSDRLAVNGEGFFSASSMVYLRNSFFAGFFSAALLESTFRHPRLLILDTVEDKGMEPERSHHFQNLLASLSQESQVEHQLIYATAMISPDLANSEHVVDRFYTHDDRSLNLR